MFVFRERNADMGAAMFEKNDVAFVTSPRSAHIMSVVAQRVLAVDEGGFGRR